VPKTVSPRSLRWTGSVTLDRFLGALPSPALPEVVHDDLPAGRPGQTCMYYVIERLAERASSEDDDGRELILSLFEQWASSSARLGICSSETSKREVLVRTRTACELAEISYERLLASVRETLRDECPR
jgi:CRP/FNR family cyclic AMP-dependent transcriptional regulator